MASAVDFVGGLSRFPRMTKGKLPKMPAPESASLGVTTGVLRRQYNVTQVGDHGKNGNMQSVTALIGQYFSQADLAEYEKLFAPEAAGLNVSKIVGPDGSGGSGTEAALDVEVLFFHFQLLNNCFSKNPFQHFIVPQVMVGLGMGTTTWFWSIPNTDPNADPFIIWVQQIGNTTNPPQVHSTSYGGPESDETAEYLLRMDAEFMAMGSRGLSLMFASGDSGVGCAKGVFAPDWPASSAYVTAVGGTKFSGLFETGHEVVNGLSGGGFSNVYGRPSYQAGAVAHYLSTEAKLPPSSKYNSTARGYPDVSALSAGFVIVMDRVPMPGVAGTSCASPTFSAIIALLNQIRLAKGRPPMGFLNPWIYQTAATVPGAFFDVTSGSNAACGTSGFPATSGWDPSSGVGTPNMAILSTLV